MYIWCRRSTVSQSLTLAPSSIINIFILTSFHRHNQHKLQFFTHFSLILPWDESSKSRIIWPVIFTLVLPLLYSFSLALSVFVRASHFFLLPQPKTVVTASVLSHLSLHFPYSFKMLNYISSSVPALIHALTLHHFYRPRLSARSSSALCGLCVVGPG